jgi:hypothetical protein
MKSWSALVAVYLALACSEGETRASQEEGRQDSTPAAPSVAAQSDAHLISISGMGVVRLAMTLDEARRALPGATFARTSDGDGVALVEVTFAPDTSVVVYADEDDAAAPIDWS